MNKKILILSLILLTTAFTFAGKKSYNINIKSKYVKQICQKDKGVYARVLVIKSYMIVCNYPDTGSECKNTLKAVGRIVQALCW